MSESLREQEMLWEHKPQASVSTAFTSSPKLHEEITPRKKENNLFYFDHQYVNSLCSRNHFVNSSR